MPRGGKNTSVLKDRTDRGRNPPSQVAAGRKAVDAALKVDAWDRAEVPRIKDRRHELNLANHVSIGFGRGGHRRGIQKEDCSDFEAGYRNVSIETSGV